jgi:hypothetical protein
MKMNNSLVGSLHRGIVESRAAGPLSLAPGFSRVALAGTRGRAASAASPGRETAEAAIASRDSIVTRLKPGANERCGTRAWIAAPILAALVVFAFAVSLHAQSQPEFDPAAIVAAVLSPANTLQARPADLVFDPETMKYVTCAVATASSPLPNKQSSAAPAEAPSGAKAQDREAASPSSGQFEVEPEIISLRMVPTKARNPVVQIALLLDTSNSMDGLIAQAKSQLWKIVNEFINAKQNGKRPDLEVALFEYGKSSLSRAEGYIRLIVPLTNDLDKISEELFALKTNGGDEYCGWVIQEAVARLTWSARADDFKAIFIAGNEPFTQGPVDFRKSCKAAVEKGIVVNTIHCGNEAQGVSGQWRDGALVADGKFMFIDQNRAVVHYDAPQDKQIAKLGEELNRTYIAYGSAGREAQARQSAQDVNASTLASSGALLNRALCKASDNYRNGSWDLVDACKDKTVNLETMKKEELPPEMQKLNESERKAYVEAKAKEREKLQADINRLNAERSKFVAEEMKKTAQTNTLDQVMIATIREQATRRNYRFE